MHRWQHLSRRRFLAGGALTASTVALGLSSTRLLGSRHTAAADSLSSSGVQVNLRQRQASLDTSIVPRISRSGRPAKIAGNVIDADVGLGLDIVPREQWGPDELLRFGAGGVESWKEMFVPPKLIVIHHTATPNNYTSEAGAMEALRSIYRFHTLTRDWGDIAYHAVIDKFGNVYEGRHGRGGDAGDGLQNREVLSQSVTGGHTTEYEYGTIGVALLGDSTAPGWGMPTPSGPMWDALVRYCTFEAARSAVALLEGPANTDSAKVDFLRSDDVWHDGVNALCGHREVQQTACPGDVVISLLPTLRSAVSNRLESLCFPSLAITASTAQRELLEGSRISVTLRTGTHSDPRYRGLVYGIEAWYKPEDSEDIDYLTGYSPEAQPRMEWASARDGDRIVLLADKPGHYTFHLRALLQVDDEDLRSADRATLTFLVRSRS